MDCACLGDLITTVPAAWFPFVAKAVLVGVVLLLLLTRVPPEIVMLSGVTVLLLTGVIDDHQAFEGFANSQVVTIGVLFIVGEGVRNTGGVAWISDRVFGRPKSPTGAIARMMLPTMVMAAFMKTTALVAMLIPGVSDWGKQNRISLSKLMIPLSYSGILGGVCTLLGTSTNLVVNGMYEASSRADGAPHSLAMFDLTWVGLPCAIVGGIYLLVFSRWLLPDRKPAIDQNDDPREYTVEMLVAPDSSLIGKTIEDAGLRHLPGVFLAEIDREGQILPAVSRQEVLRAKDRLVFVGVVDSIVDLQRIRGLAPATDQVFKLSAPRTDRCLIEAVVSDSCPLVGRSIRDGRFRSVYNAVVIAVARNGERLKQKIGDIVVKPGDTFLIESHPSFVEQHRNSRDFFLVSRVEGTAPPHSGKALLAASILMAMVLLASFKVFPMVYATLLAAGAMLLTRCATVDLSRKAIKWDVLVTIGASFGVSKGLEVTHVADHLAMSIIALARHDPWWTLCGVYGVTMLFTEVMTHNAAVALMFPLAHAAAATLGVNFLPFVIVLAMAGSASFATPVGYATNLMVYGPGGYKFSDYLRIGIPLNLMLWAVTVVLTPIFFPFR
ncbi:MAG TPA: SLC13 family permease [Pirellulales bacterium]|jgi:di/tricarboxylate transporter|nr:SLC13 family permease [Pirellulales bacterium]